MGEIEIGVSVISLLPESWGAAGLLRAGEIAKRLGLSLQLNPIIGYRAGAAAALAASGAKVVSIEYGSWAATPGELMRKAGRGDVGAVASPLLFGIGRAEHSYNELRIQFPNALEIDHPKWHEGRGLIEVSPNDYPTLRENDFLNAKAVVFDTWHVREQPAVTHDPMVFARKLLQKGNIKLIHAQTRNATELANFCAGVPTQLGSLLKAVLPAKVPVIIELDPRQVKADYRMIECMRDRIIAIAATIP